MGFVDPNANSWVELPGFPGSEINLQDELGYYDQQKVTSAALDAMKIPKDVDERELMEEMEVKLNLAINGPTRILAWVNDWKGPEFQDKHGNPVAFGPDALKWLDTDTAKAIHKAIDERIEKNEAEKKLRSGRLVLEPTSSSANGSDGLTTTYREVPPPGEA